MDRPRHRYPSKLRLEDAAKIRAEYARGVPVRALTAEYGVSPASVYAVLQRRAHRCVVAVELADDDFARLVAAATRAARTREEIAAEIVRRGLDVPACG